MISAVEGQLGAREPDLLAGRLSFLSAFSHISLASPQGPPTASNSSARALSATGPAPQLRLRANKLPREPKSLESRDFLLVFKNLSHMDMDMECDKTNSLECEVSRLLPSQTVTPLSPGRSGARAGAAVCGMPVGPRAMRHGCVRLAFVS